jgi:Sigma-70, region 4/SnoaL-like domain
MSGRARGGPAGADPARRGGLAAALPGRLPGGAAGGPPGPAARYEQAEAISLAFVTALQVLSPRQLAVLILRDVLGFPAREVAGMLGSTAGSVTSALKRARASLRHRLPPPAGRPPPPPAGPPAEEAIAAAFARAWESADLDALVALLTGDVFISMPPMPFQYQGRDAVARFCAVLFGAGRRFDLVPTRANGQPAFGAYLRAPGGQPPRHRPVRADPGRRPDLRHDPLRGQRAAMVRAPPIAPQPMADRLPAQASSPCPTSPRLHPVTVLTVARRGGTDPIRPTVARPRRHDHARTAACGPTQTRSAVRSAHGADGTEASTGPRASMRACSYHASPGPVRLASCA